MLGQDYNNFGRDSDIISQFGDNQGYPFQGPVQVSFLDKHVLCVISYDREIFLQNIHGSITDILISENLREKKSKGKNVAQSLLYQRQIREDKDEESYDSKSNDTDLIDSANILKYIDLSISDICTIPSSKYLLISDIKSHSIKLVNRGLWNTYEEFGIRGRLPGQYDQPNSISCLQVQHKKFYITTEIGTHRLQIIDNEGVLLYQTTSGASTEPGRFHLPVSISSYLPKEFKDSNQSLFEYISPLWRSNGKIFLASDATSSEDSIWELLKKLKIPKKGSDPRPYAFISVADNENKRIQIFRFYWITSDIFSPSLELHCIIVRPSSVCYSSTGELAICDQGGRKVIILSRYMELLCEIKHGFLGPYNITIGKQLEADTACCSVSYSVDGCLAVGYRNGGIVIYSPYKYFDIGKFDIFTKNIFSIIISYNNYIDLSNIRDTCKCLHDFTRNIRDNWDIHPMRGNSFFNHAQYCFIKFARLENGGGLIKTFEPFQDNSGKLICLKYLNRFRNNRGCQDKYCIESHKNIYIDILEFDRINACIELTGLKLAITELFSTNFLWYIDLYIEELFSILSFKRILCDRSDPMTRRHEVLRNVTVTSHK
eukprot:gene727-1399_t